MKDDKRESSFKIKKYRQSGHYIDQKLKYSSPSEGLSSIFDHLTKETQEKVLKYCTLEIRAEGIKLTTSQDKLMNALLRLLSEKSETKDQKSDNFYGGNEEAQMVPYGGDKKESRAVVMRLHPTELYKAYLDRNDYSGDEIRFIKDLLQETEKQRFLIVYERHYEFITPKGKKEKRIDRIEEFQPLFHIMNFFEGLTLAEHEALEKGSAAIRNRKGELLIALNPLLTDQIQSKYVEYPIDINRRTIIAAGGHRSVTPSIITLRDYLLREISAKRTKAELNEENLISLLKLENYAKSRRKKLMEKTIAASIQASINLGIITNYERTIGASGQWKYIFQVNLNFE